MTESSVYGVEQRVETVQLLQGNLNIFSRVRRDMMYQLVCKIPTDVESQRVIFKFYTELQSSGVPPIVYNQLCLPCRSELVAYDTVCYKISALVEEQP